VIVFESFRERLASTLESFESAILDLWRKTDLTEFRNDPHSPFFFVTHPYRWKSLPIEHKAAQARLLSQYRRWFELFHRCHVQHSGDVQTDIAEINTRLLAAIELQSDWGTAATFEENRLRLKETVDSFRNFLQQHITDGKDFVVVPDTNALLITSEPARYADVVDSSCFRFVIVPTVLAELDELKRTRSTQSVGEKAEKAIRIIKGLRKQGSVLDGVTVSKTITVQMVPTEPRLADLPSWLDADNKDDRIIASTLEIQAAQPSATVVLVTDDINLQNKAEMAFLPWAEPPEPLPTVTTAVTL
jgi:rRNA-processing protein FCF1